MTDHLEFAVIGAGPAGLAAATRAAELGLTATVLDEQPSVGGQIYRSIERTPLTDPEVLGDEYTAGNDLVAAFRASGARHSAGTEVWMVGADRRIGVTTDGAARVLTADRILIAVGSLERPVPFPGWTLPGVMTAGAGQILLKAAAVVPSGGVVLAGTGPLLFLIAAQYARAGVEVKAVLDTTPRANFLRAAPYLPRALLAGDYLARGLAYKRQIRAAGIPIVGGVRDLRAIGEERVEAIAYRAGGRRHTIETGLLMVHFGVVPSTNLSRSVGIEHVWDERQLSWHPRSDAWGNSDVEGIAVAGDCSGIRGARAAERLGRLAALEAARALGRIGPAQRDREAAPDRAFLRRDARVRPFLETLFSPAADLDAELADEVLVCRCEEVIAGQVRQAVATGCAGPNQVKAFVRAGMGPCQGRQCSDTVSRLVAGATGRSIAEVGFLRARPPVKPITIEALTNIEGAVSDNLNW